MRIDDLISKLSEMRQKHGNLRVGHVGHYGELYELDEYGIDCAKVDMEHPFTHIKREMVVELHVPNIGEEPD